MLESSRRLGSCYQTTRGMTHRNVDCVMTNHNEGKTKSGGRGLTSFPSRAISWLLFPYRVFLMKANDNTLTTRKAIKWSYRLVYRASAVLENSS